MSRRLAAGRVAAVVLGMALAGCGAASSPSGAHSTATPSSPASSPQAAGATGLTLSRLNSLTNYTFTSSSSNDGVTFKVTGQVHSSRDWKVESTIPVAETRYDVDGRGYAVTLGQVITVSFATPEGLTHLDGEYTAAESLIGYTHVLGEKISPGGSCQVAGEAGLVYRLRSPSAASALLVETATACVAKGSGALLSYTAGVPSGSASNADNLTGASITFTVDSIGGVAAISAPRSATSTPTPSVPTTPSGLGQLPQGFPQAVAPPPGQVMSSAQLGPTKWYVELSESNAGALAQYESELKAQGFSVSSATDSSAADLVTLTKSQYQVLLEQTSLPGQGVVLAVTVQS